jgi:hypothetical protein
MQTPPPKDAWSLHVVILSKCVFVFEIFLFGWGIVPTTPKKFSNFFQPSARKVHSVHQEKRFFFSPFVSPENVRV